MREAKRSRTASSDGLVSVEPSANRTVGTIWFPSLTPATHAADTGSSSTSISVKEMPRSVRRCFSLQQGPHQEAVKTVIGDCSGMVSVTGARMPE